MIESLQNQLSRSCSVSFTGLRASLIKPLTGTSEQLFSVGLRGLKGYNRFQQRRHSDYASFASRITNDRGK